MGILDTLTLEQKKQAFIKASDNCTIPDGKLVLVTEEYYDGALKLMQTFAKDEPLNKSVQLEWCDDFKALGLSCLQQNLSLMIVHRDTGEPMALRTIHTINTAQKFDPSALKDEKCKKMIGLFQYVEREIDVFKRFGCTEAFHFFMLSVAEKYRNRGLGSKIVKAAMDMIQNLGLDSAVIKGEGTSNYSKRIYEKCGFEILHEVQFSDYVVEGEQVFCNTGDHKSMKTYAIKVQ